MPEYRVLAGTHRTRDGERVHAGETVEMSEELRDRLPAEKFERVEEEVTEEDDPTVQAATEPDGDEEEVEASGDVPDDYTVLSKMGKLYDGEEVHGSMSGDELTEFFEDLSDTEIAALKQQARDELED